MRRLPLHQNSLEGVVYSDNPYPGIDPLTRERNRRRIRIFLSVVALGLLVSLSFTFLRPAIYGALIAIAIRTLLHLLIW